MDDLGLLDRDRELGLLGAVVDAASHGSGSVTVVEGPAGIGKSRLLRAVRRMARESGVGVLSARATELEKSDPFGVTHKLLPDLVIEDPGGWEDTSGDAEARARAAIVAMLDRVAAERPTLVSLDDLHWCDRESLAVVRDAIEPLVDRGCAIVIARRPEVAVDPDLVQDVVRDPDATILRPRPLAEGAVAKLVSDELGREPDPLFVRACAESSGGNPFLLRALLLELDERGIEPTAADAAAVPAVGPQAVGDVVARRLSGASAAARALVEAIALLGDGVEADVAASLAGLAQIDVSDARHELARAGIFARDRDLAFAHAIVRAAVLERLRPDVVAARQRDAARVLAAAGAGPDTVGRHVLLASPAGDEWVVAALRAAARHAIGHAAPDAAVRLLERARREPPPADRVPELELELGTALGLAGRGAAAVGHLEAALGALADSDLRADAALRLARAYKSASRYDECQETLRAALADDAPDPRRRFSLRAEYAWMLSFAPSPEPALEHIAALEREALPGTESQLAVLRATAAYSLTRWGRRRQDALEYARRAFAGQWLAREQNSYAFASAGFALLSDDRLAELLERIDSAAPALAGAGAFSRIGAEGVRTRALTWSGRLVEAADCGATALAACSELSPLVGVMVAGLTAEALMALGRLDEAQRLVDDSLASVAVDELDESGVAPGLTGRSRLHLAAGRHPEALADAQRAGELLLGWHFENPALEPWRSDVALALLAVGERDRAIALVEEELELARRWGAAGAIARALRTRAVVRADESAVASLRDAEALMCDSEVVLERAEVDVALGIALVSAGADADAAGPLRRGLATAERIGAAPLAARARAVLVSGGARPRRAAAAEESLTKAERRVCRLAAEGASNAEIAEQLVVSPTTVRTHLRAAFRKLGVASRSQLVGALAAADHAHDE